MADLEMDLDEMTKEENYIDIGIASEFEAIDELGLDPNHLNDDVEYDDEEEYICPNNCEYCPNKMVSK